MLAGMWMEVRNRFRPINVRAICRADMWSLKGFNSNRSIPQVQSGDGFFATTSNSCNKIITQTRSLSTSGIVNFNCIRLDCTWFSLTTNLKLVSNYYNTITNMIVRLCNYYTL